MPGYQGVDEAEELPAQALFVDVVKEVRSTRRVKKQRTA
jgi:hypothetical protein